MTFNLNDVVRVVSTDHTGSTKRGPGVNSDMVRMAANKETVTVTRGDETDNTYQVRTYDGVLAWFVPADLELVKQIPTSYLPPLKLSDVKIGDKVKLRNPAVIPESVVGTATSRAFTNGPRSLEDIFTVGDVDEEDSSVEIEGAATIMREWIYAKDLTSAEEPEAIEEVTPTLAPLDVHTLEVDAKVKLLNPTLAPENVVCGECPFEDGHLELEDTFTVLDIDEGDLSVLLGTSGEPYSPEDYGFDCWVFAKDLVPAEEPEDTGADTSPEVTYIITNDSVTLSMGGDTDVATIGSANFAEIRQAVVAGDFTKAHGLMNISIGIQNWSGGSLQIANGEVTYNKQPLTGKLVDRVVGMMAEGDKGFQRLANFLSLTMEQTSFKTRSRLMDFAAHDKLDLTDEGYVVAFKNVRSDYYDKHSGKFRNQVGDVPSMPRSEVDDDHDSQCSNGLHVCSPPYLQGFWGTSGRTMRVVVKPQNFVAIPYDYDDSKARVCEYEVVEDVTNKMDLYL